MQAKDLTPVQRKLLKARAHRLDPVLQIGGKGVTPELLAEIARALQAHELIKVRAAAMDRREREAALAEICRHCGAQPVQHVGKVLVIYCAPPEARPGDRAGAVPASSPVSR